MQSDMGGENAIIFRKTAISRLTETKTHLDRLSLLAGLLETRLDRRLNVGPTKGRHFAEFPRYLNAVVEEDAQLWGVDQSIGVGD